MNQLFQAPQTPLDNDKLVDLLNLLTSGGGINATSGSANDSTPNHQVYTNLIKSLLSLVTTLYMPLIQQQQQHYQADLGKLRIELLYKLNPRV
jgi:hypothetical protein